MVTLGNAAASTATVSVNAALSPAAMAFGNVAVTTWPEFEKLHGALAPPTNVSPAGSVSRTVTGPTDATPPPLVTTIV